MYKMPSKCFLCNRKASENLNELENYYYCHYCNLAWIKKYKKVKYGKTYYKPKSNMASKLFSPIEIMFYKLRNSYTGSKKNKLWIDIGAGDGKYLEKVIAKNKIGVEVSRPGINIMKKNGLKTMTNEQFLNKKGLNADIISFWHVLEHVTNPWDYIRAAKRNLKNKGNIIIAVPNIESYEFKLFKKYWFHLVPKFHIWHFSPKAIELILNKEKLKIKNIDYWSIEHHLTGLLQSFINYFTHSDSVLHRLIKRGLNFSSLSFGDFFWITFWCTLGLPIVLAFWIIASITHKSGTFVIIASH